MKRAVFGMHHSISEAHLPRYLAEWDFKWNTCNITDGVLRSPSKVLRAGVSRTASLVKTRALKQKAMAFLRWRDRK
jgi:hypothetical protein